MARQDAKHLPYSGQSDSCAESCAHESSGAWCVQPCWAVLGDPTGGGRSRCVGSRPAFGLAGAGRVFTTILGAGSPSNPVTVLTIIPGGTVELGSSATRSGAVAAMVDGLGPPWRGRRSRGPELPTWRQSKGAVVAFDGAGSWEHPLVGAGPAAGAALSPVGTSDEPADHNERPTSNQILPDGGEYQTIGLNQSADRPYQNSAPCAIGLPVYGLFIDGRVSEGARCCGLVLVQRRCRGWSGAPSGDGGCGGSSGWSRGPRWTWLRVGGQPGEPATRPAAEQGDVRGGG